VLTVLCIYFPFASRDFKESVEGYLCLVAGGRFGSVIGPNTAEQYEHVLARLRDIEVDPFIQVKYGLVTLNEV
jgi:hypothetical protein